jgi:cytochrome c-type biogenesis protein CcmF
LIGNIGFSLALLAFIAGFYGIFAAFGSAYFRIRSLFVSATSALVVSVIATAGAAVALMMGFLTRDFTIQYVAEHSSSDLPLLYTISAFWASLAGSHLFWTLFMGIFAIIAIFTVTRENAPLKPFLLGTQLVLLTWMYHALITHSDPFVLSSSGVEDGIGLNALLQNPYMASHPPLLFIGYSLLFIPFCYGIAALMHGEVDAALMNTLRKWTLTAFAVLTVAITLGGRWAYEELGWAGYWAWDPVENASLLPWLITAGLTHVLIINRRTHHLKGLTVILAISAFIATFFGTFLTRSGVVSSVHAFAKSPIGINYLLFVAFLLIGSIVLYGLRAVSFTKPFHRSLSKLDDNLAAMFTFVILAFAAIVFVGMVFPIIVEASGGGKLSIQAPYYNTFAPYVAGLIVLLLTARRLLVAKSRILPLGAFLAHAGTLTLLIGFCGNVLNKDTKVTLGEGQSTSFGGYEFTVKSPVTTRYAANHALYGVDLSISKDGAEVATLYPSQSFYPTDQRGIFTEVSLWNQLTHDVYVTLSEFSREDLKAPVTLSLHLNYLVSMVWTGVTLIVCGSLISFMQALIRTRRKV